MNLSGLILKLAGWKVEITAPNYDKCLICVAPHTSNWDFVIGKLAYASVGRTASFLMKKSWFFFPLGLFFESIGGIPVDRNKGKGQSLVDQLVSDFRYRTTMRLAITPEGTRKRTTRWHTGFLQISYQAHLPCLLAVLDYKNKQVLVNHTFWPTGNTERDMRDVKRFYQQYEGKYPDKFTTEDDESDNA